MQKANRIATWVLGLAAAGLILYQQSQLNQYRRNSQAAGRLLMRLQLENSALSSQVKHLQEQSWVAPLLRPLTAGGKP